MASSDKDKRVVDQCSSDAKLLEEFDVSSRDPGTSFHYTKSVVSSNEVHVGADKIHDYALKIQSGGLIQPFGCLIAVREDTFQVVAHSENAMFWLGINSDNLLDYDLRTLFTISSSQSLVDAIATHVIANPVVVTSVGTKREFYAIVHGVDVGTVIDLEPIIGDSFLSHRLTVSAHKFAYCAISNMQLNTQGNIKALCDEVAIAVKGLTLYDRVMVYKFHHDEHGEVLSEVKRPDLESYLGLHYPATDIPQAARFLFMTNRMRMICDARAKPVPVVQNQNLENPLLLGHSTLRAPHGCHVQYMINMNSIASLVMAIVVNENNGTKLWGLVSCHHELPCYLSYPVRCACELVVQAFESQLSLELQREAREAQIKVSMTQVLLCNMISKGAPFGIFSSSPNIMDLVHCEGVAFCYGGACRVLGLTPSESQIKEFTEWLFAYEKDLTVWNTDSLLGIGYPCASELNGICGIVAARITSKDMIMWFRVASGEELNWAGAGQQPTDGDDGEPMHPRSSFKAFLEVVKDKCFPWEPWELNAVRIVRDTMNNAFMRKEQNSGPVVISPEKNDTERKSPAWELVNEMERIFDTAIVPAFTVDAGGIIRRWNFRISELTGLQASEAVGRSALHEVIHNDSEQKFRQHLHHSLQGQDDRNIELRLRNLKQGGENASIFIVANACSTRDSAENILGVWFVAQDVTEGKIAQDKLAQLETDYRTLTQDYNPALPPMFLSDKNVRCSEWSASMAKLTGWNRTEVVGKMIPGEIFGGLCKLKSQNDATNLMVRFCEALCSNDHEALCNSGGGKEPFGFYNRDGVYTEAILSVYKRVGVNDKVVGCLCFLQPMSVASGNVASAGTSAQPIAAMEMD